MVELGCFFMDCSAGLRVGDPAIRCCDLEDHYTRELGDLSTKEGLVSSLDSGRPAGSGLRPAKLIDEERLELEALEQVACSGYVQLGHRMIYGLRILIL